MGHRVRWWWVMAPFFLTGALQAQRWDTPAARMLAERATRRREGVAGTDPSWTARAHGTVLFLAQVGEGLAGPPRLVRADELDVEVYRGAPGPSKQVIRGWRTRSWLPTDIDYHRDHLGIVTDGFGDRIRIGDGDEVRDVPHPLSVAGLLHYAFALTDSIQVTSGATTIVLDRLDVRPRDPSTGGVVGSMYIDRASAELVRFQFGFTRAAYVDPELEDITVSLESALVDQRAWLPFRQEIEIRRQTRWLDFPARGIIRGRWEIGDYDLAPPSIPLAVTAGPAIGGLLAPGDSARPWGATLEERLRAQALPLPGDQMAAVRRTLAAEVPRAALDRLETARLHAPRLSDLIRFDRVEGVALGAGLALAPGRWRLVPHAGVGLATGRMTGGLRLAYNGDGIQLTAEATRTVRDFSDLAVISPTLNSLTAEEAGKDFGDYLLLDRAALGVSVPLGGRSAFDVQLAREQADSLPVAAHPATGEFRPNPQFEMDATTVVRLGLRRTVVRQEDRASLGGSVSLEGGAGGSSYLRMAALLEARWPLGATAMRFRGFGGAGTVETPAWRGFALGGRGTLVGEPFRAWGGREAALASLEWRLPVIIPVIPLGNFASTGQQMMLAPFVAAGWAGGPQPGMPWVPSPGVRPVAGIAAEWLMGLLRIESGWSLRTGSFGVTVDVSPEWWGVL
ncbi:MAG: hypothetical protein WBC97_00860 [Gemmatimonadales bacterium]